VTHRREPLPTDVEALPPLPPAFDDVLDAGLATLRLTLAPVQRAAIADHVRLLLAWTSAINLTAIRDPVATAREHVLDSLSALPILREHDAARVLDLGSGGGFPGLPLAIGLPDSEVALVDSVGKKAAFLAVVTAALGLAPRVAVVPARAETLAVDRPHRGRWSVVVARAVTSLPALVELALPLLAPDGILVAWKRWPLDDELIGAGRALDALGGGRPELHPVDLDGLRDHVLVVARKTRRTPTGYPRDPTVRRRRPW
jgi:16S rRNA (guanine527-N7)-methyltransferase